MWQTEEMDKIEKNVLKNDLDIHLKKLKNTNWKLYLLYTYYILRGIIKKQSSHI